MAFYKPRSVVITLKGREIPVLAYIDTQVGEIRDRKEYYILEEHLMNLYKKNEALFEKPGEYHFVILWKDGKDLMTDIWIYDQIKQWSAQQADSGALLDAEHTFRELEEVKDIGLGAELGDMVRVKEIVQRMITEQNLGVGCSTEIMLKEWLYGERPKLKFEGLDKDLTPKEEFYIPYSL